MKKLLILSFLAMSLISLAEEKVRILYTHQGDVQERESALNRIIQEETNNGYFLDKFIVNDEEYTRHEYILIFSKILTDNE